MKRGHMEDEERWRDRSPDMKRQRHSDGHYQHQRYQQSNDSYQYQQRSDDSYSRRDERYNRPRRPDSSSSSRDHSTRRDERDTPTPYERQASAYEHDAGANGINSYVTPAVATTDNYAAGAASGSDSTPGVRLLSEAKESDPHRLAQRQKQIDYGKNTVGYDRYCAAVPRHQRRKSMHPMTPDRTLNVSKKAFDGMIRKWRQALHKYDPPELQNVKEEQQDASASKAASSATMTSSSHPTTAVSSTGETAWSSSVHAADMADLDPERYAATPASTASTSAPTLSIFENFVEGDMDNDDDDDLL